MPKHECIIIDVLDNNLCFQTGEGIFKAECTVPGTVISAAYSGVLAMQHARNQQHTKSTNI
jgi:hypothetical protein